MANESHLFNLKVGFDWDAPPSGDNLEYLFEDAQGKVVEPVSVHPDRGVPTYAFKVGDVIHLEIFNINPEAGKVNLTRVAANVEELATGEPPVTNPTLNPCGQLMPSMSYSGNISASEVAQSPWDSEPVPVWLWINVCELVQAGLFEFAFSLSVYSFDEDTCRSFKFDPEMQVDPDEPDPEEPVRKSYT